MKAKYTKKQIQEAINYWQKQINKIEAFEILNESMLSYDKDMISESLKDTITNKVKKHIDNNIKNENDVKKFIDSNDTTVQKTKNPILQKTWNILKTCFKLGKQGLAFIAKHWKWVLVIIAIVLIAKFGVWGTLGKLFVKALDSSAEAIASGFEAIVGNGYIEAGTKISDASVAAGGYGGWSQAGLGGGLR